MIGKGEMKSSFRKEGSSKTLLLLMGAMLTGVEVALVSGSRTFRETTAVEVAVGPNGTGVTL